MRQAISTRYLGSTDHRGSRVKATAQAGSVTVGWDDALDSNANHERAARALISKWGWTRYRWIGGGAPDGRGNVYVCIDDAPFRVPARKDSEMEHETSLDNLKSIGTRFLRDGAPDGWEAELMSWLNAHDPSALESVDDDGAYPSDERARAGLAALGYLDTSGDE